MGNLSAHFDKSEFEHGDTIPDELIPIFTFFAQNIMEPIRAFVGRPLIITSGYRTVATNSAAHGVGRSEHVASQLHCAADFTFATAAAMTRRQAFDWIRSNSAIPFHQVILETSPSGSTIIHVSLNRDPAIFWHRQALEGATANASPYTSWEVVAYNPQIAELGKQENA